MPNVGVLVRNASELSVPLVQQAEVDCRDLFLAAGIRITWINTDEDVDWTGPDVVLRAAILRQAPASRAIDVFGSALPKKRNGLQVFVYCDRMIALSRLADLPLHVILSGALSHEIGHMLLGSSEHSVAGVMRGEWGRRELDELGQRRLRFTPQQKQQLVRTLRAPAAPTQAGEPISGR